MTLLTPYLHELQSFVTDPSRRLFWGYLLASGLGAFLFLKFQKSPVNLSSLHSWWTKHHLSLKVDLKFFVGNAFFDSLLSSTGLVSQFALSLWVYSLLESLKLSKPEFSLMALWTYAFVSFLVFDFLRFFQHYLMHHIPVLWRFHRIHHSASTLSPLTLYRVHPVENILSTFRKTLGRSAVFSVGAYLFGLQLGVIEILGVNAFAFLGNLLFVNLRHTPWPLSFGPLEWIFLSPAQHQLHHSKNPKHFNSNLGVYLSLWDQLFGSFQRHQKSSYEFGLNESLRQSWRTQMLEPLNLKYFSRYTAKEIIMIAKLVGIAFFLGGFAVSAESSEKPTALTAPLRYEVASRFGQGSSVNYSGQVFRQILNKDLDSYMEEYSRGNFPGDEEEAFLTLWSLVDFDLDNVLADQGAFTRSDESYIQARGANNEVLPLSHGNLYGDLSSGEKQILNKLAGNDNPLRRGRLLGWESGKFEGIDLLGVDVDGKGDSFIEPEDLLWAILKTNAHLSTKGKAFNVGKERVSAATITESGIHLSEIAHILIHAAMSFSQAAGDYLSVDLPGKGLQADNTKPDKAGAAYTTLEHHWDEAFGYFGASRNYGEYSDLQIQKGISLEYDEIPGISLFAEKNYGVSIYAAKRDLGDITGASDYTKTLFELFVEGRQKINQGSTEGLEVMAHKIKLAWEKLFAANAIHYINSLVKEMGEIDGSQYSFAAHAKYWSEMKAYALGMQFNPESVLSDSEFVQLHLLLRDQPVLSGASELLSYTQDLLAARELLREKYSFSVETVENW